MLDKFLSACIFLAMLLLLIAALTLPIGCRYCMQAVIFERPISGFENINVFVGAGATRAEGEQVLAHLPEAARRVSTGLGVGELRADIVVAPRDQLIDGAGFAGAMSGSLLGAPVVMLPTDSLDVAVTAHELVHVYFENVLGQNWSGNAMPHWFNEGMAEVVGSLSGPRLAGMCVLVANYGWPSLRALRFIEGFQNTQSHGQDLLNYAFSAAVVKRMMASPQFQTRLNQFLDGKNWSSAFSQAQIDAIEQDLHGLCDGTNG